MGILNKPSTLPSAVASQGTSLPEDGYLFNESGLPYDVNYLGKLSISAAADAPAIVVADTKRLEYGGVALSSVQQATKVIGTTAAASAIAIQSAIGTIVYGLRESGGASSLTIFVKTTGGATLSGFVSLGPVI